MNPGRRAMITARKGAHQAEAPDSIVQHRRCRFRETKGRGLTASNR